MDGSSSPGASGALSEYDADEPMPSWLTPLVDREADLAAVVELLGRDDVRLVTLTGPGGVGKTRLAIAAERALRGDFADGARFVALDSVTDPAFVLTVLARALGVRESGGQPLTVLLRDGLGDRSLLLILDNFEHLTSVGPDIASLVASCEGLKILVTSRHRLGVRGEHVVEVLPLDLPERSGQSDPAAAPTVKLFLARAGEADNTFSPTSEDVSAIVEICRRLDGLPLAIELAAARIRLLPARALLARLEKLLPVLTGGHRDLPARQRTLRDTIAWSFELLPPRVQDLFTRLALFAGGFSLDAAEAITGSDSLLDDLGVLVDRSLLRRNDEYELVSDAGPRYVMLESVREFGLEQFDALPDAATVRQRYAVWFAGLAASAAPRLTGRDHIGWYDRLGADYENLRTALLWFADQHRIDESLALAGDLWRFWLLRGHLAEGRARLTQVLALASGDVAVNSRAQALIGLGAIAEAQGDDDQAERLLDEAVALARAVGQMNIIATALLFRGIVAFDLNDVEMTLDLCRESCSIAEQINDSWCAGLALSQLGLVAVRRHEYQRAEHEFSQSLARFQTIDSAWGIALATGNLGILAHDRRDFDRAAEITADALTMFQAQGDRWGVAAYLEPAARAAAARGQHEIAARLFGAATALREAVGIAVKPIYQGSYDLVLASLQSSLGEARYTTATAEGARLTSAQAVALAIQAAAPSSPPDPSSVVSAAVRAKTHTIELSKRQREVLVLLTEGLSDREIGEALFIGHRTVQTHVSSIFDKLGVFSRTAAASTAVRLGLV